MSEKEKFPKRIVSLTPSLTEILFALKMDQRVVGVTDSCDYPTEVKDMPHVGCWFDPDIEKLFALKPDLVLLDIGMPNLDGYELCSLLRKHSYFKSTPVIMVTGRTGFVDRAKAKLVRASGYLTKPFTQGDLLKVVFQHLDIL